MKTKGRMTALIEFDASGELREIFLNAGSDEEEKKLKGALARLIKPSVREYFARLLAGNAR
jgi:hypothetical protein